MNRPTRPDAFRVDRQNFVSPVDSPKKKKQNFGRYCEHRSICDCVSICEVARITKRHSPEMTWQAKAVIGGMIVFAVVCAWLGWPT
jgi:hypothetical protein